MHFANRVDAGRQLAAALGHFAGENVVVVGIPRGGVPVAAEVARSLHAPLDVILVRKLGVPGQRELAMGAIGEDGARIVNDEVVRLAGISPGDLDAAEARERNELALRAERFRRGRPRHSFADRTVIIVDDGIATGSTALAACHVARTLGARHVVLAVPVAPVDWTERIDGAADELIALHTPQWFGAVGQFYADFGETTDTDVIACLDQFPPAEQPDLGADEEIEIQIGGVHLGGRLTMPPHPSGMVIFAHGSGSSRHSPRNIWVADVLNASGIATLLFDLLTTREEADRSNVFDVGMLARRLGDVTAWWRARPETSSLPVGYFGASTGAAAALLAAADEGRRIAAVVSRGGRPDLAASRLAEVTAPTLLIVGGRDHLVLDLNRQAQRLLTCVNDLVIVPGASHLFEEGNTLDQAAAAARDWFVGHFAGSAEAA